MRRLAPVARHLALPILVFSVTACGGNATGPMPVEPDGGIGDGAGPPAAVGTVAADLEIVIESPDSGPISYRIRCEDDQSELEGASELNPMRACAALTDAAVRDRLLEGPPVDRMCTQVYGGPETATIRGSLDGRPVDTVVRRNDGCGINDWDNLLADVLVGVASNSR